jgi:hypothetical protein
LWQASKALVQPVIVAGAPFAEALARQVGGLTRRIVDLLVAEVPFYRPTPRQPTPQPRHPLLG